MDAQTLQHKTGYKRICGCFLSNFFFPELISLQVRLSACIVCNHSHPEQLSQGKCFLLISAKAKNPVSFFSWTVDAHGLYIYDSGGSLG